MFALQTITPQVGGAAVNGEHNLRVRPTVVANGLRRWWRALHGHEYPTTSELFRAEEDLWGSAAKPGSCKVDVLINQVGTPTPINAGNHFNGYPSYAFGPLQGGVTGAKDIRFTLRVVVPRAREAEVRDTVAALVCYGGVGARTRRGCGSLTCTDTVLTPPRGSDTRPADSLLTMVPASFLVGAPFNSPVAAWNAAVAVYMQFRQGEGFARDKGSTPIFPGSNIMRPGQSRYPEADSLRILTNMRGHPVRHTIRGYPRADLGLPIRFEFMDAGEPPTTTLNGSTLGRRRFGSPVITKALAVDGGYRPMLMVLNSPHVWEGTNVKIGDEALTRGDIDLPPNALEMITPLSGRPIREALVRHARSRGFKPFQFGDQP